MSEHKIPIPSMIYNAAVGGHVTNSQQIIDENLNREQNDINQETVGVVPYNSTTPNGMGRIVLKKNDNFKQVVEAQIDGNTIFVIKYDFTLTDNVTIPANCVLKFDGGSVSGAYTLTCNNTLLDGNIIISLDTNLNGKIKNTEVFFNWFGAKGDGVTDDILPIQKAIDTCFVLENINVVTGIDGKYLISKPINLNATVIMQRHNICLRGQSIPFSSFRKGLQILGNTGTSMLECIDGVNNVIENIDFMSYTNGSNPSTIGVVVSRGDLQYTAKFTIRNCYINIGYYSENSRNYNDGFGSIGLFINGAEESIFDNVEVCANCCFGLAWNNTISYLISNDSGITATYKSFSYTSFYDKTLTSISNTVYRLNSCRFLTKGKIAPAIINTSSSSVYINDVFTQTTRWDNNNGYCDYSVFISSLRNSKINGTFEGYGTAFVVNSQILNSKIHVNLDGGGKDGLIYLIEPESAARDWENNDIYIYSNNTNTNLFKINRSYASVENLFRLINNTIKSNVVNKNIIPAFSIFYRNNDIELEDISYLQTGYDYSKILNPCLNFGSVDDTKYYKIWEYVVGDGTPDIIGSDTVIDDTIVLTSGGVGDNPSPCIYVLNIKASIMNLTASTTPDFSVRYSFTPITRGAKYDNHTIKDVEPFVVYKNEDKKVCCYLKITRTIPGNDMNVRCSQEIIYRGNNVKTDKQIIPVTETLDDLNYFTPATNVNYFLAGTARPTVPVGTCFFDTTSGVEKPIWYKGNNVWVDATGAQV